MTKVFPSYADIMKQDEDVKVVPVSQHFITQALHLEEGVCGGMSVQQIKQILNPNIPKATNSNPFKHNDAIEESVRISETNHYSLSGFVNELQNEPFISTGPIIGIADDELGDFLHADVENTMKDNHARGVFIGAEVHRIPQFDEPLPNYGGHALSFTAKKKDGEIYCSGLDSNMFFAKAKGKTGCDKLIKKLVDTMDAYESTKYAIVEAEASTEEVKTNTDVESQDLLSTRGLARRMR